AVGHAATPWATTSDGIVNASNSGTITNTNGDAFTFNITGSLTNAGTLTFNTGSTAVNLSGNLVNNGTATLTNTAWAFNRNITLSMGSAAQTVGGSQVTTFKDVTTNNSDGITLVGSAVTENV